jgi:hypothetical protein
LLAEGLWRLRVTIENHSPCASSEREAALAETLLAAHLLLGLDNGSFVSLLEPSPELACHAAACAQAGLFPVLIGKKGSFDRMLASPIILYDYPEVAAQSSGDLFDATEIDEILTLRILTLTDQEKREMRGLDARVRALLERSESVGEKELLEMHGLLRPGPAARPEGRIQAGDRVRLRPKRRADIFDIALAGRIATVRSVEQDFEDRVYLSVTVEGDPGEDLGLQGQPGHRFFFEPDEVEPLEQLEGG